MLHLSSQIHDLVFAVGSTVLLVALLPAVVKRAVIPISTCFITGSVLAVFTLNYLSMSYWYAMVIEVGNVGCWVALLWLAARERRHV